VGNSERLDPAAGPSVAPLAKIVGNNQTWDRMAAKYGVDNSLPPWKTSLDGICDALDQSSCGAALPSVDRRNEEDALSATVYSELPYPENRLVALAHSLVRHGLIDETELEERLVTVRARLEA
jgi:hypothetical protein